MLNIGKKNLLSKKSQAERLETDFNEVTNNFKNHPLISIKETSGTPVNKYRILYRIDGLQKIQNAIETKSEHEVEIFLSDKYPKESPICKPLSPVFHPNISLDSIDIKKFWNTNISLCELILYIAKMISFQKYDTANPLNYEAAKWTDRNKSIIPLYTKEILIEQPQQEALKEETRIIISEEEKSASNPEVEARKTEGIIIASETSELSLEEATTDARKTAVLEKIQEPKSTPVSGESQKEDKKISAQNVKNQPLQQDTSQQLVNKSQDKSKKLEKETSFLDTKEKKSFDLTPPSPPSEIVSSTQKNKFIKEDSIKEDIAQKESKNISFIQSKQKEILSDSDYFFCWQCGFKNVKGANFCSNCGVKLWEKHSEQRKKYLFSPMLVSVLISIPVAIISALAMYLFMHSSIKTQSPSYSKQQQETVSAIQQSDSQKQSKTMQQPESVVSDIPQQKENKDTITKKETNITSQTVARKLTATLTPEQKNAKILESLQNGRLYLNLGSYDQAINKFMYVLQLDPQNEDALEGLRLVREAKDKEEAEKAKQKENQ